MHDHSNGEVREPIVKSVSFFAELFEAMASLSDEIGAREITNVWMDSRKIEKGDLFVALEGDVVNGHDFVEKALEMGAVAAVVAKNEMNRYSETVQAQLIVVENPFDALQSAAREYRRILNVPFIAITGSNGKTTTAHFIREVLSTKYCVGTTHGNFNNHIGLPLSILRFNGMEDVVVLEMGANHSGEIAELTRIAEPDMGVITNIGYAHIGEFGSIDVTATTKFELADAINEIGGLLFLNGDDRNSVEKNMKEEIPAFYFGERDHNTVKADNVTVSAEGHYSFEFNGVQFDLATPGKHFMYSLLPALVIAFKLGIDPESLREKVKTIHPANLRGTIREINGARFIEDCYNANPSSMQTAAELLRDMKSDGKKVAVVGDMFELGKYSDQLHKETGEALANCKTDLIIAIGEQAENILEGAKSAGMNSDQLFAVESVDVAATEIFKLVENDDLVLVKGSRGMGLERLFPALTDMGAQS